jgi:hypothetical protein
VVRLPRDRSTPTFDPSIRLDVFIYQKSLPAYWTDISVRLLEYFCWAVEHVVVEGLRSLLLPRRTTPANDLKCEGRA